MDITPGQATVLAVVLAGVISLVVQILTARRGEGSRASEAEITVRGKWVQDMQTRVRELEEGLTRTWEREQEAARKCREEIRVLELHARGAFNRFQADMESLDRRWRHLVRSLLTRDWQFRRLLQESGVPDSRIPPFHGLSQFEEEGGNLDDTGLRSYEQQLRERDGAPLILIVEDNRSLALRYARQLEIHGYRTQVVGSSSEALDEIKHDMPALILCDILLEDGTMDGVQLAAELRARGYGGPLIAITGGSRLMDPDMLTPAHFAELLQKPVVMSELVAAMRRHLSPPEEEK